MIRRIKKKLLYLIRIKKKLRYLRTIDGYAGYLCILDEILGRELVRPININGYQLHVRTNTPDLNVAITSLHGNEYNHIRLSAPKTIVDAGANIGTSSIFFATKYPGARIFAIEPEAGNFELLKENTKNYSNIVPIRAAIWGSDCTRTIQNRFTGHWGYTVSETTNRIEPTGQEINCVTMNSLRKEYGIESIDLLKMDIEGGEKDVLENAQGWIDCVDTITVELHDRICMGCDRAFYLATKDFVRFEKQGEKVTAYRI
jgi:FkbM family methyltransferase